MEVGALQTLTLPRGPVRTNSRLVRLLLRLRVAPRLHRVLHNVNSAALFPGLFLALQAMVCVLVAAEQCAEEPVAGQLSALLALGPLGRFRAERGSLPPEGLAQHHLVAHLRHA